MKIKLIEKTKNKLFEIINNISKSSIYEKNMYIDFSDFNKKYYQNVKNIKDLLILQYFRKLTNENISIFVNLGDIIEKKQILSISESFDILLDNKENYDVLSLNNNIIVIDHTSLSFLKNYYLNKVDKIVINFGSNLNINLFMLNELLSLLSVNGKLIFDITKYSKEEFIKDKYSQYQDSLICDPVSGKLCIKPDINNLHKNIFGKKFVEHGKDDELLDYEDIYCFLKEKYEKYDFNVEYKGFEFNIDTSTEIKLKLISKNYDEEALLKCKGKSITLTKTLDNYYHKREIIYDFDFIKKITKVSDKKDIIKKILKKEVVEAPVVEAPKEIDLQTIINLSEKKSKEDGDVDTNKHEIDTIKILPDKLINRIKDFNINNMAYIIFTKVKIDEEKLYKEFYENEYLDILRETRKMCEKEEYLIEKKTGITPLKKSLLSFRGYYN